MLQQFADGQWQLIAYFSCKLSPTEHYYSTYDRELFAMYVSVKYFRYLEGRSFSDHKPLTFSMSAKSERSSSRQACHLDFIVQFTADICFTNGTE